LARFGKQFTTNEFLGPSRETLDGGWSDFIRGRCAPPFQRHVDERRPCKLSAPSARFFGRLCPGRSSPSAIPRRSSSRIDYPHRPFCPLFFDPYRYPTCYRSFSLLSLRGYPRIRYKLADLEPPPAAACAPAGRRVAVKPGIAHLVDRLFDQGTVGRASQQAGAWSASGDRLATFTRLLLCGTLREMGTVF